MHTTPRTRRGFRGPLRVLRVVLLSYVGLAAWLAAAQRRYIYFPQRQTPGQAEERAQRQGLKPWRESGGGLIGWRRASRPRPSAPSEAVLILHGNAGYAQHRAYFVEALAGTPGLAAIDPHILEYPGYGMRSGKPGEAALRKAAMEALHALQEAGYGRIYLLGESLGSGLAAWVAGQAPDSVAGLLLVTPFTSLADVAQAQYPFLPARWLLRDRYDARSALERYQGPVFFLVAERDEVIPPRLAFRLHEAYRGPKDLALVPGGTHNTLAYGPEASGWREAWRFLRGGYAER